MALSTRNVVTTDATGNQNQSFAYVTTYTVGAGTELLAVSARGQGGDVTDWAVSQVRWEDSGGGNPEILDQAVFQATPNIPCGWWVLENPTARAGQVVVEWSRAAGTLHSYSTTAVEVIGGVDTASPVGATNSATGTSATAALSLTSTVADSLLLSSDSHRYAAGVTPFTPDAGVTELTEGATGGTSSSDHGYWVGERLAATPGAYAMGVTASASDIYAIAAIEIKPAATGISGSLTVTQDDNTLSATGSLLISGTASLSQADNTLAATGSLAITGSANISQADNTLIATMTGAIANVPGNASLQSQGFVLSITAPTANASLSDSGASATIS